MKMRRVSTRDQRMTMYTTKGPCTTFIKDQNPIQYRKIKKNQSLLMQSFIPYLEKKVVVKTL